MKIIIKYVLNIGYMLESNQELLSGADIQKKPFLSHRDDG